MGTANVKYSISEKTDFSHHVLSESHFQYGKVILKIILVPDIFSMLI